VSDQDFFILLPTAQANNFPLPENSGVVDKGCWFEYFGPWANRLSLEDQSHSTNQEKRRKKGAGYDNYKDMYHTTYLLLLAVTFDLITRHNYVLA
jgi:hypothetical protein